MAVLQIADICTAVEIYYNSPALGDNEIMRLFTCSRSTAQKKKREVKEKQKELNIMMYSKSAVNTCLAYQVWGLDIKDLKRRAEEFQKLKQKGVVSQAVS